MALRFADSFDHYTGLTNKYVVANGPSILAGNARFVNGLRMRQGQQDAVDKVLDSQATWIVGFAFRLSFIPGTEGSFLRFRDNATDHVDLRITTLGTLRATRNGTSLGIGTKVLSAGVFYFIEVKVTIDDAAGVFVVKVDGVTDINLSSQDTRNGANASADRIGFKGYANSAEHSFDDAYICDTSGGAPTNDFLGDVRVEAIFPSGNGNSSALVGSDGNSTDNYLLVDEVDPNGDTDYVQGSAVGDKDTYAFGNVTPTAGTVYGVLVHPYARKTDAGVREICSVARLSGTEVDSANKILSTSYQYLPDIREAKPGGGAWAISDVNSAEFGVKVTV